LAFAALALVVFGAYDSFPKTSLPRFPVHGLKALVKDIFSTDVAGFVNKVLEAVGAHEDFVGGVGDGGPHERVGRRGGAVSGAHPAQLQHP